MKRHLIYMVLILAIVGCKRGSDEDSTYTPEPLVGYDITTGEVSRAEIVSNSATMESVGVLGAATAKELWASDPASYCYFDLIPNRKLIYNDNSWKYLEGEEVRWGNPEANDMFSFFGYSPYQYDVKGDSYTGPNSESYIDPTDNKAIIRTEWPEFNGYPAETTTMKYPRLHYDCPELYNLQRDVLIAEPKIDIYRPHDNHVPLTFHHALTCVGFQVRECVDLVTNEKPEDPATTAVREIKKVWIEGIYSSGSVIMDGNKMDWIPNTGEDKRDKIFVAGTATDEGKDYYTLKKVNYDEPYSTNFMNPDGYMMLLPQILPSTTAKIKIEFTNGDIYDYELGGEWVANKRIVYNITIGAMGITSLQTVSYDWEQTLIFLTGGTFTIDGVESDDWRGAIVASDFEIHGAGSNTDPDNTGANSDVFTWEGYVSPGSSNEIGGAGDTTTGTTGTTGSEADVWEGYVSSGGDTIGGASDTTTGSTGTSGDDAMDWDGYISSGGDTIGGAGGITNGNSGGAGDNADAWEGGVVAGGDTIGGAGDTSHGNAGGSGADSEGWEGGVVAGGDTIGGASDVTHGSAGSSGDTAEGWEGNIVAGGNIIGGASDVTHGNAGGSGADSEGWEGGIVSGGHTIGGASDITHNTSGSTGDTAEGWEGSVVGSGSLELNEEELEVNNSDKGGDQWGGNSTIVGGEDTSSGLTDTSIK